MVVEVGETVWFPVPTNVPPQLPVYHLTSVPPLPTVADMLDELPLHIVAGSAVSPVGAEIEEETVTATVTQPEL